MKRQFDSEKLLEMLRLAENVLIIPHNDPDPDAIASALALAEIIKRRRSIDVKIAYQGIIGRAENRALVEYLGQPLHPLTSKELKQADAIALIDTQPGAGNHPVPPGMNIAIVIDHHSRHQFSVCIIENDLYRIGCRTCECFYSNTSNTGRILLASIGDGHRLVIFHVQDMVFTDPTLQEQLIMVHDPGNRGIGKDRFSNLQR